MSNLTDTEQAYLQKRARKAQDIYVDSLDTLKAAYTNGMRLVWEQEGNIGPAEVFEQLGTEGGKLFTDGEALLTFILAYDPTWDYPKPTHEYTIAEDGTVTVGPKIGTPAP